MYFIFYRMRHPDGSESDWQAGRKPFANKAAADAMAAHLLTIERLSSAQSLYASAVARSVRLPS